MDAWAKSGGGRKAAERAEEILEWMDRLHKAGNVSVRPDTITFNAVLDAWARSGDRMAAHRAEQILDHMDELYRAGNLGVKPDTYTYNTLINAHAKSSEKGSAARAEHVLEVMKKRYLDGDGDFKPNTRTHTSVVDAWAKSGEKGAARRAEQILNNMIASFEETRDHDSKPNVHTANAVCNVSFSLDEFSLFPFLRDKKLTFYINNLIPLHRPVHSPKGKKTGTMPCKLHFVSTIGSKANQTWSQTHTRTQSSYQSVQISYHVRIECLDFLTRNRSLKSAVRVVT